MFNDAKRQIADIYIMFIWGNKWSKHIYRDHIYVSSVIFVIRNLWLKLSCFISEIRG